MRSIPEATVSKLTNEEQGERDDLVRSTRTEYRLRQRARIVLMAVGLLLTYSPTWGLFLG